MRVVGIMLVRNEDLFVERAVRNTIEFCDEFLIADHQSTDGTWDVLRNIAEEFPNKIQLRRVEHPRESHAWIRPYAGGDSWIFGVDGDEIYDPAGLARLRADLQEGLYKNAWCVFGNVLNVKVCDFDAGTVQGHLAPPCRSMTKLYNFAAIRDWAGDCVERLHGGSIEFKPGFHDKLRRDLHQELAWEESPFRCLHLCFLRRSSEEYSDQPRKNIMDRHAWTLSKTLSKMKAFFGAPPAPDWKEQRYGRGPLVEKSLAPFFPAAS